MLLWPAFAAAHIDIFVVVPQSGPYKDFGDEIVFGAKTASDGINASGGLIGKKIILSVVDDACSENLALSTAQMLSVKKEDKPSLVIGPYCSDGLKKIAEVYAQNHIFQIVPAFLSQKESLQNYSGLIKLFGNKEQAAHDIFEFYNTRFAPQKAALLISKDDTNLEDAVLKAFQNHGKSSLINKYYFDDFTSLDDMALKLKDDAIEVVLSFTKPRHTSKIIRNIKRLHLNTSFLTSRYIANTDFFANTEDDLDNVYFMGLPEFEDKPEMAQNIVKLRLRGIEFKGLNIYGYTAVKMWAEIVKKNKTTNYNRLSQNIKKYGLKTSWGETFFNNGNIKTPFKYSFYKYLNGEYILP